MISQLLILFAAVFVILYIKRHKIMPDLSVTDKICIIAQAGILSAAAGATVWVMLAGLPEKYNDFIGGFLAISGIAKTFEYTSFYTAFLLFILLLLHLLRQYSCWQKTFTNGIAGKIAIYSLIPAVIMIGQALFVREFLLLLLPGTISVIFGVIIVSMPGIFKNSRNTEQAALTALCSLFLASASIFGTGLFCNRLGVYIYLPEIAAIAYLITFYIAGKKDQWHILLVASELGVPLLFAHLLPMNMVLKNGTLLDLEMNILPIILVAVITLASYAAIFFAAKKKHENVSGYIPTLVVLALVSCFCASPETWPGISGDDYHDSEAVLPWYLLWEQGALPYTDYIPSRGAINYISGFLVWLFKGHDFSMLQMMNKWADLPLYFLLIFFLRRHISLPLTLAGVVTLTGLSPLLGAGVAVGFIAWLWLSEAGWDNVPVKFLLWFIILGIIGAIYSLTDFLPLYISMFPLAFYAIFDAFRNDRKRLFILTGITAAAVMAVLIIPVTRQILFAMLQILFLQSSSYTTAHCVPHMPMLNPDPITPGVLWDTCRFGFIAMGIIFTATIFFIPLKDKRSVRQFLSMSALVIFVIIMIQRAGGRIDTGNYSRIYLLSSLMWAIFMPLWYIKTFSSGKHLILATFVYLTGTGIYGTQISCLKSLPVKYSGILREPENSCSPEAAGLPHLGKNSVIPAEHFKHHQEIRAFIKEFLRPGETIWDLSNNATVYAYHDLPLAMRYPSYFYAADPRISSLLATEVARKLPPLALIEGRNIEFHEGKLPLRAYPLYRLLLDNYRVFKDINGKVWMIKKGEEERLTNHPMVLPNTLGKIGILSPAVADKKIDAYPVVWGNSWNELSKKLANPVKLNCSISQTSASGIYFPGGNLSGDFLFLRFNGIVPCKSMRVAWLDSFGGAGQSFVEFQGGSDQFLIPVSTSPNWYLAKYKSDLQILFAESISPMPQLVEASLWHRP